MNLHPRLLQFVSSSLLLFCLSASAASAAPVLVLLNGRIATADGVVVDGKTYDVDFLDGFCDDIFGGCNGSTVFAFDTMEKAAAASQALLDTVFLNLGTFETAFDGRFNLTNGCFDIPAGVSFFSECRIRTPYAVKVGTNVVVLDVLAINGDTDSVHPFSAIDVTVFPDGQTLAQPGFSFDQNYTWARWRLRSTDDDGDGTTGTVPEPVALSMLGFGLAGAAFRLRRKRRAPSR